MICYVVYTMSIFNLLIIVQYYSFYPLILVVYTLEELDSNDIDSLVQIAWHASNKGSTKHATNTILFYFWNNAYSLITLAQDVQKANWYNTDSAQPIQERKKAQESKFQTTSTEQKRKEKLKQWRPKYKATEPQDTQAAQTAETAAKHHLTTPNQTSRSSHLTSASCTLSDSNTTRRKGMKQFLIDSKTNIKTPPWCHALMLLLYTILVYQYP